MSNEVDYEAKVKEVYPDAECFSNYNKNFDYIFRYYIVNNDRRNKISHEVLSVNLAWQSAYNQIKAETRTQ